MNSVHTMNSYWEFRIENLTMRISHRASHIDHFQSDSQNDFQCNSLNVRFSMCSLGALSTDSPLLLLQPRETGPLSLHVARRWADVGGNAVGLRVAREERELGSAPKCETTRKWNDWTDRWNQRAINLLQGGRNRLHSLLYRHSGGCRSVRDEA